MIVLNRLLVLGLVYLYLVSISLPNASCVDIASIITRMPKICKRENRLSGPQVGMCANEPDVVEQISLGIGLGIDECQHQMMYRRWNCSAEPRSMRKILNQAIRETGFVHGSVAAGVLYQLTHACTIGDLFQCGCLRAVEINYDGHWKWGGCGDDVLFGYTKSKEVMEKLGSSESSDPKTLIDLHNSEAGRLAIMNYMNTQCKCHGVSGSCTMRTCWQKMPSIREVGARLKSSFDGATKVTVDNNGMSLMAEGTGDIKPPTDEDIIYYEESPEFCEPNRRVGSLGTSDRVCNGTSPGIGGCDLLCCGRGKIDTQVIVRENCKCRFIWCCDVHCSICTYLKTVSICL